MTKAREEAVLGRRAEKKTLQRKPETIHASRRKLTYNVIDTFLFSLRNTERSTGSRFMAVVIQQADDILRMSPLVMNPMLDG